VTNKNKLRRILGALKPDEKALLAVDDLRDEVKDNLKAVESKIKPPLDFSDSIELLHEAILALQTDFSNATKNLTDKGELEIVKKEFETKLGEIVIPEIPEGYDDTKLQEEIKKLRLDLLNRINNLGGGAMNRQILIGGIDYLTTYTDINLIGSITATNNNSKKRVDIDFSAVGGVDSINGLTGAITLAAGTDISLGTAGNTITINNTATPFALTSGSGTTANGTTLDLGGVLTSNVNIDGGSTYETIFTNSTHFGVGDGTYDPSGGGLRGFLGFDSALGMAWIGDIRGGNRNTYVSADDVGSFGARNITLNAPSAEIRLYTSGTPAASSGYVWTLTDNATGAGEWMAKLPIFSAGSVIFSNGTDLTEDNANFFWDDTNNRLGIGTASPSAPLHIIKTTEQARFGYNTSNYGTTTVASTGRNTYDITGSDKTFVWNQKMYQYGTTTLLKMGENDAFPEGLEFKYVSSTAYSYIYGSRRLDMFAGAGAESGTYNGIINLFPTGTGTVAIGSVSASNAKLQVTANDNSSVGFIAQYGGTTPTANAMEIRNSAGTVLGGWNSNHITNLFFGLNAGRMASTGTSDVHIGYYSGQAATTGSYNVGIGSQTLYTNTTGARNVAIGDTALYTNNSNDNVAIGYNSFALNTGASNTGLGSYSGYSNTTGTRNVAVGNLALYNNQTGSDNFAFGNSAAQNTTASNNFAFGYQALYSNVSGTGNVAIGQDALYGTTGVNNLAIGYFAGYAGAGSAGGYNTYIGTQAGYGNTNATGANTFIGYYTGGANTGSYNTMIGDQAGYNSGSGSENVFIGRTAGYSETGSNKLYIANSTTSTPLIYGEFPNTLVRIHANLEIQDAKNIVFDTTTGTKIGTSTTQKLAFYNSTPIVKPTALTTQLTTITATAPGTPDYAIQDLTNVAGYGFVTPDEGQSVLKVILNLQTRVVELETKLQALGLIA
jgi:hypothetical protein